MRACGAIPLNIHVHFGLYINASPYFLLLFFRGALDLVSTFFDRLLVGGGGITSSLVEGSIGSSSSASLAGDSQVAQANLLLVFTAATVTTLAAGTFALSLTFTSAVFSASFVLSFGASGAEILSATGSVLDMLRRGDSKGWADGGMSILADAERGESCSAVSKWDFGLAACSMKRLAVWRTASLRFAGQF